MLLTIIIPVYNVEDYIVYCLDSIYNQKLKECDFEVIIVDDGCTDDSIKRIANYNSIHNNLFILHQRHQGPSVARNLGMSMAKGKFIMFVDSDDVLVPNALPSLLNCAIENNSDMLFADYIEMDDKDICEESILLNSREIGDTQIWTGCNEDFLLEVFDLEFFVWRIVFKRDFLESRELTFLPGILYEDVLFTSQCIVYSKHCVKFNKVFYVYRRRQNSIVHSVYVNSLQNLNEVLARITEMQDYEIMTNKLKQGLTEIRFEVFSILIWYIISIPNLYNQRMIIVNDLKKRLHCISFNNNIKQRIITLIFNIMPIRYIEMRKWADCIIKKLKYR